MAVKKISVSQCKTEAELRSEGQKKPFHQRWLTLKKRFSETSVSQPEINVNKSDMKKSFIHHYRVQSIGLGLYGR